MVAATTVDRVTLYVIHVPRHNVGSDYYNFEVRSLAGALWVGGQGDALIENCLFENNTGKFGGMMVYHVTATLENLVVVGNDCSQKGGGIDFEDLNPDCEMIGCTVVENDANPGAGIMLSDVTALLCENSLVAFNTGAAPLFCDRVDYLLQGDSPCLPGNHPDGKDCATIGVTGIGCGFLRNP